MGNDGVRQPCLAMHAEQLRRHLLPLPPAGRPPPTRTPATLPPHLSSPAHASYDKRDGTGKMTFVSGLRYEGEWKEDKAHGCGAGRRPGAAAGDCSVGGGSRCGVRHVCCALPLLLPATTAACFS